MRHGNTREDGFVFYSVTVTSFLESAVPAYVENLCLLYEDDARFTDWLTNVWIKEESEHGVLAKEYVQEVWPEFDWINAYNAYYASIPKDTTIHLRKSKALEALARCVTETEATMIYRCIRSYTSDSKLMNIMAKLSTDEVRHYKMFRKTFEDYQGVEKNSLFRIAKTILGRSELVRARDLEMAFTPINAYWIKEPPFVQMDFEQFVARAGSVMSKNFPTVTAERMLFKPLNGAGILAAPAKWLLRKLIISKYPNFVNNEKLGETT